MARCLSLTELKNWCYRFSFTRQGLRSTITDLHDGTVMHCWVPATKNSAKPNLLLIHGVGANALWQWGDVIRHLIPHFNLYVPDLVFFGESYTTRPDRSESFQAQCVMRVMEANGVEKMSLVGLSYGGFVGYSMAAQFKEAVERVVVCCSGLCMEEKDLREGLFRVSDLEEAASILVPQSPEKLKKLVDYAFFKPPPVGLMPNCFFYDFIDPTLIIWAEYDKIFPLELGYRLKRHLGDNGHLVVVKNTGHAFNVEKPREFIRLLKSFLVDLQIPPDNMTSYICHNHK